LLPIRPRLACSSRTKGCEGGLGPSGARRLWSVRREHGILRRTVGADLLSTVYGDNLYYYTSADSQTIVKVPRAGGTSERFYYNFDLWAFDIVDDQLLVSTFNRVNIANVGNVGNSSGLFVEWMTLIGNKVFALDDDEGLSWVNLQGTQSEGLFSENMFFGAIKLFDGYAYIIDDTRIRRMKLPE
jgi:hypothetical protein